jgi:hypothetical protein
MNRGARERAGTPVAGNPTLPIEKVSKPGQAPNIKDGTITVMNRKLSKVSLALGASGILAAGLATTATAASAAAGPAWHRVLSVANSPVRSPYDGSYVRFDAVVATGKTTGWAFRSDSKVAYERAGSTAWKKVAFPGGTGTVEAAAATSPSSVWAAYDFSGGSQIDHWNGKKWSVVKTFPAAVTGISALGANDVWVYGGVRADGTGVWHFNGRTWAEVSSTLQGGSALSDGSVWAYDYGANTVDHFNGRTWTATSVAKLLPPPPQVHPAQVTGVLALSASNVYATAVTSFTQGIGGPLELLHYNGHSWSKVATTTFGGNRAQRMVPDGRGGLFLAGVTKAGGQATVLRYSGGRLTAVPIPASASLPVLPFSISLIPGTSQLLAGGVQYATASGSRTNSVVEQFS